jgi:hypothetical protein
MRLRSWPVTSSARRLRASASSVSLVVLGVGNPTDRPQECGAPLSTGRLALLSDEEIGCRCDCKELGLAWPASAPVLSERDATASDYSECVRTFRRSWAALSGKGAGEADHELWASVSSGVSVGDPHVDPQG